MKTILLCLAACCAIAGCGRKAEEYNVPHLVKTLKEHADPDMRGWAARELGRFPDKEPGTVAALTAALQEPDATVRAAAAYGLADIGPEASAALPALHKANQDQAAPVRKAAAYALKEIQRKK